MSTLDNLNGAKGGRLKPMPETYLFSMTCKRFKFWFQIIGQFILKQLRINEKIVSY